MSMESLEMLPVYDTFAGELLSSGKGFSRPGRVEVVADCASVIPDVLRAAGQIPLRVGDITDLLD